MEDVSSDETTETNPSVSPSPEPSESIFAPMLAAWGQSPIAATLLVLATIFVLAIGTLYLMRPELFAPKPIEDGWAESGLGVELPEDDINAYQEAATALEELAPDPTARKKAPAMREKAIELLQARAVASLRAIRIAGEEYVKHMKMYKGAEQRRGRGGRGGGIITEAHWVKVQQEWEPFQPEIRDIVEQANWLRPGRPGWGAAILQEAYDVLHAEWEEEAAACRAQGEEPPPFLQKLRFGKGARVACNMGERGWVAGTVLRCFELPYLVALDQGGNVTAPADNDDLVRGLPHPDLPSLADDKGTPEGADLSMWKEFRFKVGDQVMANLGQQGFMRGRVRRISVKDTNDREAAYEIEIDPGGRMAYAPHDVEQIVRRCTPEEAAAMPKLRFKKGDRVVANMGQAGFKPGTIVGLFVKRHPGPEVLKQNPDAKPIVVPYQVKLDEGPVVFAPNDDNNTVRPIPPAPVTDSSAPSAGAPNKGAPSDTTGTTAPVAVGAK